MEVEGGGAPSARHSASRRLALSSSLPPPCSNITITITIVFVVVINLLGTRVLSLISCH